MIKKILEGESILFGKSPLAPLFQRGDHSSLCKKEFTRFWRRRRQPGVRRDFSNQCRHYFETLSKKLFVYVFLIVSLTGCASVQTGQEWERVRAFAVERTGVETRWEQSEDDVKKTQEEVGRLLSDGLTMDDAVGIALLNNRDLQATFEEIGIAKADLVQAGLYTNPDLGAVFRFPFGGGGVSVEGEGLMNIADFWRIPLRKKTAAAKLEASIFIVSDEILKTQAETKIAYTEYIALSGIRDEVKKLREQAEELKDHLHYRREFGLANDLDVYLADAEVLDVSVELARIEEKLQVARIRLNRVLGLTMEQYDYEVTGNLSGEFRQLPGAETLMAFAFSQRPDIQAAKLKIEESRRILALERKSIFRDLAIGAAYARESDGTDFLGPGLAVRIPLFDQNQARIARAEFRMRQAEKEMEAKTGRVREEISAVLESIVLAREQSTMIRDQLLPVRRRAVAYAEEYFNAMQLNMLYLIDARHKLSEAQKRFLEAVRDFIHKEIELEKTLGGMIPSQ